MVTASDPTVSDGVLGTRTGELVLRVAGGPRDGQVIRLAASKCAIGSAANCTLRLRGQGVQPLHCLILRGPAQTIIRRWSTDTRLNGRSFDDAPLAAGDRLSVGPIEFDVVATADPSETSAGPSQATQAGVLAFTEQQTQLNVERAELERRRAELDRERGELEARLSEQVAAFDRHRAQWESERHESSTRLEAQLQERSDALLRRTGELDAREHWLAQQQAELTTRQADVERREFELRGRDDAHRRQSEELDARRSQLEAQTQELEGRRSTVNAERDELIRAQAQLEAERRTFDGQRTELHGRQESLAREQSDLDARTRSLDERQQSLDAERGQLESDRESLRQAQTELDALRGDLARQSTEVEALRHQLHESPQSSGPSHDEIDQLRLQFDAERAGLQAEICSLQERLAAADRQFAEREGHLTDAAARLGGAEEQLADRDARLLELECRLHEHESHRAQAERECERLQALLEQTPTIEQVDHTLQTSLEEQTRRLELAAEQLNADRAAFESERRQWSDEREQQAAALQQQADEQASRAARLHDERAQLEAERKILQEEREAVSLVREAMSDAPRREYAAPERDRTDEIAPPASRESADESSEEIGFTPLSTAPPVSTSDLFERLGINAGADEQPAESIERTRERQNRLADSLRNETAPPTLSSGGPVLGERHDDEEESIDSYMQKLLERTRGGGTGGAVINPVKFHPQRPIAEEKPPIAPTPAPTSPGENEILEPTRPVRPRPTTTPESAVDMTGLRELANLSARGAIASFERRQHRATMIAKTVLALIVLGLGATLVRAGGQNATLYFAGVAGILFGALVAVQAVTSLFRLNRVRKGQMAARRCEDAATTQPIAPIGPAQNLPEQDDSSVEPCCTNDLDESAPADEAIAGDAVVECEEPHAAS